MSHRIFLFFVEYFVLLRSDLRSPKIFDSQGRAKKNCKRLEINTKIYSLMLSFLSGKYTILYRRQGGGGGLNAFQGGGRKGGGGLNAF